jgi:tape measure domain-containing protein
MAAQQLNVRVGLLFDEKSLANIERQMRNSGRRLSSIGSELTMSLSLPLAAFGVAAIKSAGDIESLTLALKSQLGTADAAAKELDKLTEAAKNPGLGVEQAVRGSVRLQGVGFAAEEARQVLIQMGNAIASTGGSAEELDAVTRQFAQMTSKGRVLQEDVSVLSENMPGLAQLMQKAFGTQSVEAIRAMGITGKEFVLQITKAAEALPRVEGGIKNGIGNAIDSLKQSAAKVGFAINEAFDVTGAIESVSGAVLVLAQAFGALPGPIKTVILSLAGIAIATGPILKGYGAIKIFGSQLVSGWATMVGAIKPVIAAFNALNLATRAFILVGVIAAVLAFASAFNEYQTQLTDAEKAQQSLLNIQKQAADSIQGQKSEVDTLVAAYKAEGTTLKQKEEILKALNKISPEYFGGLRAGKGDVDKLTEATKRYGAELLNVAELNSLNKRLEEISTGLRDVNKAAEPSTLETLGNIIKSGGNSLLFAAQQSKNFAENSNALKTSLLAEQAALQNRATELALNAAATGNLVDEYKDLGGASDEAKEKLKTLKDVLEDVKNSSIKASLIGDDADEAKIEALQKGIERLIDAGFKPASVEVKNLKSQLDALTVKPTDIEINIIRKEGGGGIADLAGGDGKIPERTLDLKPVEIGDFTSGIDLEAEKALAQQWQDTYIGAAQTIADATANILGSSFQKNAEAEIAAETAKANAQLLLYEGNAGKQAQIKEALAAKIAQIEKKEGRRKKALAIAEATVNTAVAITKAIASAPPPFNVPAIVAASIAGAAQIATIAATPFARGTAYAPGGTALVGEQGPELINLPRGSQVFPTPKTNAMLSGMGGGGVTVGGEFTVRGTDLVLVLERTQNKNERFR